MRHENQDWKLHDEIDRMLDATLANYAAQPRAGLEQRILANLRMVETRTAARIAWNWGAAMALGAVLMIAASLGWRWARTKPAPNAKQPSAATVPVATEGAHRQDNSDLHHVKAARRNRHPVQRETAAANPKLDVFPSPLPLSEQERLLEIYVRNNVDHAALLAEARMSDLRQEAEERRVIAAQER